MVSGRRFARWAGAVLIAVALVGATTVMVVLVVRYADRPLEALESDHEVDPRVDVWMLALERHDFDAARRMIDEGLGVDAISTAGEPASFVAVTTGDAAALRWLLDHGANPNGGWHVDGQVVLTLLHHAISSRCDECAILLIDRGANVRPPLVRPRSLLHDAFGACASDEVIAALLQAGADRDPEASDGSTLLHSADCERAVRLGLEWGIDPNAVNRNGSTPLHQAARTGCVASVTLLIEAGARIDVVGPGRNLPLHYIDSRGRGQSQEWLDSAERAELVRLLTPERLRRRGG